MTPPLRSRRSRAHRTPPFLLYGVLMLCVAVAFVAFSFLKRVPGVPRTEVRAVMAHSGQLEKNAPVRIAGVDVGKVTGFAPGPGRAQTVTLVLDDEAPAVKTDARLRIRPRLFLEGGFYVDLQPGSPSARALRDGQPLRADRTTIPVQLDQLLTTFDAPTRAALQSVVAETSKAMTGGGAAGLRRFLLTLEPTASGVAVAADAVRGQRPRDVSQAIAGSARVLRAMADRRADLGGLVTGLRRTTAATAAHVDELTASLRGLDATVRAAPPALTAVDHALPDVRRAVAALEPALPGAPRALRATSGAARQVGAAVGPRELPALARVLPGLLQALPPLEQRLTTLLPELQDVAACLQQRVLPVANAKLDDGKLSTGDPVWLDLAHAVVGMAGASQDFDANGHYVRLLSALGPGAISTGTLPEVGQVFSNGTGNLIGSRPKPLPNRRLPPFRPSASCTAQEAPDLRAATAPPDFTPATGGAVRTAALGRDLLGRLRELAKKQEAKLR